MDKTGSKKYWMPQSYPITKAHKAQTAR